jgi:hypothetical protein
MVGEVAVTDLVGAAAVTDLAGEVADTLLSVAVTHLADSPAVALVRDSAGRGGILRVEFRVVEITAASVTVISVDAIATFAIVTFAILMGTFSILASLAMDIHMTTPITTHTRITTTIPIQASINMEPTEHLDRVK